LAEGVVDVRVAGAKRAVEKIARDEGLEGVVLQTIKERS
jgi:hypothetical protein